MGIIAQTVVNENVEAQEAKAMDNIFENAQAQDDMFDQVEVTLEDDILELVEGALKGAKYASFPSFFEGKTAVKISEVPKSTKLRIVNAVYGKYKDTEKDPFAAVVFDGKENEFTFVNKEALEFIKRLVDICKLKKISMKKLLSQVIVTVKVEQTLRKGHEGESFKTLEDGTNNWFYKYDWTIARA